jgi:hypothetical protein
VLTRRFALPEFAATDYRLSGSTTSNACRLQSLQLSFRRVTANRLGMLMDAIAGWPTRMGLGCGGVEAGTAACTPVRAAWSAASLVSPVAEG